MLMSACVSPAKITGVAVIPTAVTSARARSPGPGAIAVMVHFSNVFLYLEQTLYITIRQSSTCYTSDIKADVAVTLYI